MMESKRFVKRIFHFNSIDSTNDFAKSLVIREGDETEGSVVVAYEQSEGRGRLRRQWYSPFGGVYLSLALKQKDAKDAAGLGVFSALPVAKTLRRFGINCTIKWPNDLMVGTKKVGGILGELVTCGDSHFVIIGMGINSNSDLLVFPEELKETATTIKNELGTEISNAKIIEGILEEYESFYDIYCKGERKMLVEEYKEMCNVVGKPVTIMSTDEKVEGFVLDVANDGSLLVDVDGTEKKVLEGDVLECRVESVPSWKV